MPELPEVETTVRGLRRVLDGRRLARVELHREGLRWPLQGLDFAPDGMIGTSNEVSGPVELRFSAQKMLVILPIKSLAAALSGLGVA